MSVFGIFFGPIPEIFWSTYSGKPFFECIQCTVPLIESNTFVIQKRFVGGEAIFEMAMCERCREKMVAEYSEETRRNISQYIREQFEKLNAEHPGEGDGEGTAKIEVRQIDDPEAGESLLEQCIDFCVVCGAKRADCHRYSLTGLCRDDEIVAQVTPIGRTPLMVCEKCESGMSDLVSQQTRDSWDRFMAEHFGGPPGVEMDSPSTYPVAF